MTLREILPWVRVFPIYRTGVDVLVIPYLDPQTRVREIEVLIVANGVRYEEG